ncbi:hypothetical protein DSO57_1014262 [Entomophthora muscae]|uniref:Uncharacterized protein n=1 Tax=Entomophthora muscae TaxID=34485 RepID=A0ACC2UR59_9FUNG|nr:hypothetical protein DSO57_1014262 [Entomophthora muscae]
MQVTLDEQVSEISPKLNTVLVKPRKTRAVRQLGLQAGGLQGSGYQEYTSDNILAWDPLARTRELTRYNRKGPWHITESRLFRDKYIFFPAYQLDLEPPITPKPIPAPAAELSLDHTNNLFGIVYITLTGVIDTIVPATNLWSWVNKSMSYSIKLAPILWWALPTQPATRQFSNASKLSGQGWFSDIKLEVSLQE